MKFIRQMKPSGSLLRKWHWAPTLFFILILGSSTPALALFSLEISPAVLEIKSDPGKTTRAVVRLRTRERMRQDVDVSKGHFGLTDDGIPVFDDPKEVQHSAAGWITLNQTNFKINPNQTRQLRMEIAVPPGTPPGGYRAAIYFTPPKPELRAEKGKGVAFIQGRLALVIYVTVGGARPNGQIKAWEWRRMPARESESLALQVTNQGTAHLRLAGLAEVKDAQGNKYEAQVPALPVLPGRNRWVSLEFQEKSPPPGTPVSVSGVIDLGNGETRFNAHVTGKK